MCSVLHVCVCADNWFPSLEKPLTDFIACLTCTVSIFKRAIVFLILKVSFYLSSFPSSISLSLSLSLSLGDVQSGAREGSSGTEELSSSP